MPSTFNRSRRRVLIGLALGVPAALVLRPPASWAGSAGADSFLQISRIITGAGALSADVAARIETLLVARNPRFASDLKDLADAMQHAGGSREQMLGALGEAQVDFALEIARPWYLGYLGTPSDTVLKDDAVFATFLEAQSYEKIIDQVPRPTYPDHSAGWWEAVPHGVDAPAMPAQITSWTFQAEGPDRILPPDPQWRAYATADHTSIAEARRAKPGSHSTASAD